MSGDVIVTVTLNAALHVAYKVLAPSSPGGDPPVTPRTGGLPAPPYPPGPPAPVSRPGYRAGGRGVTVARVLRAFGHDVLAAGLAGGATGELIIQDLAKSGVPTAFTLIRGESRRSFRFAGPQPGGPVLRFSEPGPYITTEELGRFAADYRRLLAGAAAVVLCGSLPDGLPADTYGSLVTYAAEAGVPVILDAGGEELKHAVGHGPDLVVAESTAAGLGTGAPDTATLGTALVRLGAGAAAVAVGGQVHAVTAAGEWMARLEAADAAGVSYPPARGALVAGLVPGQLLGWSWPDRLRHALALAAGGAGAWTRPPGGLEERDRVDLAAYERLLDAVRVEPLARRFFKELPGRGPSPILLGMDADHPGEPDVASLFAPVAVEETFDGVLTEARQVLGGLDDPVDAELWGSDLIGALASSATGQASLMNTLTGSLVPAAETASTPEALALLRVFAAVGSPPLRAAAGQAAARLRDHDVADPPWAGAIGAPRVGDCWHYADVGGRQESLTISFAYGGQQHAVSVLIDHGRGGKIRDTWVTKGSGLRDDTEREAGRDPLVVFEMIDAADARLRLERAIGAGECPEQPDQVDDVVAHRALLRARLDLLAAQG